MALGALALLMWSGFAAAAEAESPAVEDAVQAIDNVVGDVRGEAVDVDTVDASVIAGDAVVEFSGDAENGVAIAVAGDGDIQLGLPFAEQAAEGEIVDGSLVYDNNNNGSTTTPLVHDDGSVQILTTIADGSAPTAYEYVVELGEGASLELTADGGAIAVGADGVATASIAPPWAYDAAGAAIPTWYEVSGNALIQHIEHAGAAYPVVADPKVSLGWKIYVKYSNWEAKTLTSGWVGNVADKAKYSALLCAGLLSGGPIGAIGAAACGAYVYEVIESVISTMKKAASKGECVELQYTYNGALVGWKGYKC